MADSLEKSFLQMVGNEVRRVGVDASRDVLRANGVVGLYHNLIDDAEVQVVNQESHLLFHARELLPESEVDCPCGFEDYPQF